MSFTSWLRIDELRRANRTTCIVCAAVTLAAAMALIAPNQAAAVDTEPLNNSQLTADSLNLLPGTAVSNLSQLSGDLGDVDFFQTPLAAGEVFFGIVTPSTDLSWLGVPQGFIMPDTIVSVFDDSGQRTLSDQDYADELTVYNLSNGSLFRFEAPATSIYRVGVAGSSDLEFEGVALDPFNETGNYVLTAGRVNPAVPGGGFLDTDPENQTAAGADLIGITPGTARVTVLQLGESDVDFFRLDLKAGAVLSAITAPLGDLGNSFDLPDTVLGLFDSSGNILLVENDNAGWEFDTHFPLASDFPYAGGIYGSALRALIPEDGTYYLAVTGSGDSNYAGAHAASGAYALLVGLTAVAVPEPATVALIGIALAGLSVASRRRDRRNVVHHLIRENRATRIVCAAAAALATTTLTAPSASAAYVDVYGGPTFAPVDSFQFAEVAGVNDAGAAIGNVYTEASARDASFLVVRWDGSGAPAIELGLGGATDINEAGTAVGYVTKIVGTGDPTSAAVRWDASGAATELMILGTPPYYGSSANAYSINDAGAAVGSAEKYVGGLFKGNHAVRWDASGTAATELEGHQTYVAWDINNGGTAVGSAANFDSSGNYMGNKAVRWDASGTAATELGHLGTDASGYTYSFAVAINDAGTAIGQEADKYDDGSGVFLGLRAVRWDASGTTATELGNLGTNDDVTETNVVAINDAGTAIGQADKYDGSGVFLGLRAVRWDASGTAATELGNLGTNDDFTETNVFAINDAGIAIGYADDYDGSGANLGERAVYWGLDGLAVDLNTLIEPVSGWTLNRATAISNTGWIGGSGAFDPDGPGGQDAYARLFLIQVPVPSALPGDYNLDGIVDAADYVVWRKTGGTQAGYNAWRTNFGRTAGTDAGGFTASPPAPVPEPARLALIWIAIASLAIASPARYAGRDDRSHTDPVAD